MRLQVSQFRRCDMDTMTYIQTDYEGEGVNVSILMEVETAGVVCQTNGVIF